MERYGLALEPHRLQAVLYQKIGGEEVMREQLLKLLSYESHPRVSVQILPYDTGVHAGLMGSFDIFHFAGDPTIVCSEDYDTGIRQLIRTPLSRDRSVTIICRLRPCR
ncbi:Scr1 family TA system antitoxin-like transcriptional regulator [Streptomyces phaeochromogenes]|uniref:Scr1 family TA system antitoxin-like transcriptional regulator n=1 Tax=Streptomyces phaeochromogenes TaxID=1923 RepID=UPI003F4D6145